NYIKGVFNMSENKTSMFFMPSINLFGEGSVNEVGSQLNNLGVNKPLLVTDEGLHSLGLSEQVANIVREAGLDIAIFPEAQPNPTDKNVADGVKVYEEESCDSIITLGGGSSHDAGKAIGIVAVNGGTIHDYEGVDKSEKPTVP